MPTTSASGSRSRKLSARAAFAHEHEQSPLGITNPNNDECFVMEQACDSDELLGIDYEASEYSAQPSIPSSLVLLQYPSSSSSSSSSHSHASSNGSRSVRLPPLTGDGAVRSVQTPLLFPVAVVPQHVPRATEIQLFLSRIEFIEINSVVCREDDVVYYVLDVFRYRQQNGLPTTRRRRSSASPPTQQQDHETAAAHSKRHQLKHSDSSSVTGREPDYQIEHRFSSFARLRSNVWQIARKRHRRGRACPYCGSLVQFFLESDAQPNLRVKFTTNTDRRKEILGTFINELLFAARDGHAQCARSLRGFHQVPGLLKRFLNEQTGENFFS